VLRQADEIEYLKKTLEIVKEIHLVENPVQILQGLNGLHIYIQRMNLWNIDEGAGWD
jgi:hypothetical protein